MKNLKKRTQILMVFALIFVFVQNGFAQKTETVDGVKLIHNEKKGKWGNKPEVKPELTGTLGELDADDENYMFYMPEDITSDSDGNLYVLDGGNFRIQKFDKDGKYLATFGREGQGPGELKNPVSIAIDKEGNMYVADPGNQRIQVLSPDGTSKNTITMESGVGPFKLSASGKIYMGSGGLMGMGGMMNFNDKSVKPLLKVLDIKGNLQTELGDAINYDDFLKNRIGNRISFALDSKDNVYLTFTVQNRVDKYSPDGKRIFSADRPVDYEIEKGKDGKVEDEGGSAGQRMVSIRAPQMTNVTAGIDVDSKGRIWVATYKRQLKEDERVGRMVSMTNDGGGSSMSTKLTGNTELTETDAYQLDVYSNDGILLGTFPLKHFCNGIKIIDNKLFIMDQLRGMQFYIYEI